MPVRETNSVYAPGRRRVRKKLGEAVGSSILEYGFWAFLLIAVGRVGQLVPGLGSIPTVKIVMGVTLLIAISRRRQLPGVAAPASGMAKTAKCFAILTVVLTPFSFWRGASEGFLLQQLPVLAVGVWMAYVMSRSWRGVRGSLLSLVWCGALLALSALTTYNGGRAATDTMYDTNDLAYILVTVLPLCVAFAVTAKQPRERLIYFGTCGALLIAQLLTESRGGLLGLIAALLFLIFVPIEPNAGSLGKSRKVRRNALGSLVVALCIVPVVWVHLPEATRARFETLVHPSQDYNLDPNDTTGRGDIWKRGWAAALDRPWGYGPKSYPMVDLRYGGKMTAPHNSILESIVELGVLGGLLFIRMYYLAFRSLQRARAGLLHLRQPTEEDREIIVFSRCMQCSLLANAVAGFFLSMTYETILWVMFGLVMAVAAIADRRMAVP